MKRAFLVLLLVISSALVAPAALLAQSGSAVVEVGSGSGSGSGSAAVSPASNLKDPTVDPRGAISDLQDARKKGWLALIIIGMYALVRVVGKLGKNISLLSKLDAGRPAMVIAGATAVLFAAADSVMAGGNPMNVGIAALIAGVGFLNPSKKTEGEKE